MKKIISILFLLCALSTTAQAGPWDAISRNVSKIVSKSSKVASKAASKASQKAATKGKVATRAKQESRAKDIEQEVLQQAAGQLNNCQLCGGRKRVIYNPTGQVVICPACNGTGKRIATRSRSRR